jgi:hypothetical protein
MAISLYRKVNRYGHDGNLMPKIEIQVGGEPMSCLSINSQGILGPIWADMRAWRLSGSSALEIFSILLGNILLE